MDSHAPLSGMELLPIASSVLGLLCAAGVVALSLSPKTVRFALGLTGPVLGFGLCAVLLGAAGKFMGERNTFRAVAMVDPSDREKLLAMGTAEAGRALTIGATGGLPLVLLAIAAMVVLYPRVQAAARSGGTP